MRFYTLDFESGCSCEFMWWRPQSCCTTCKSAQWAWWKCWCLDERSWKLLKMRSEFYTAADLGLQSDISFIIKGNGIQCNLSDALNLEFTTYGSFVCMYSITSRMIDNVYSNSKRRSRDKTSATELLTSALQLVSSVNWVICFFGRIPVCSSTSSSKNWFMVGAEIATF